METNQCQSLMHAVKHLQMHCGVFLLCDYFNVVVILIYKNNFFN